MPQFITDDEVDSLLKWPDVVSAMESVFVQVYRNEGFQQPQRTAMTLPESNFFLSMPAYSQIHNLITCKLLTSFPENWSKYEISTLDGCIVAFDGENGKKLAFFDAEAITLWRTVAGSLVAAKHLLAKSKEEYSSKSLAVLGAGKQGEVHIIGFQDIFHFKDVRLWNRTAKRAVDTSNILLEKHNISVNVFDTVKDCVKDADVIVCAFAFNAEIYLKREFLKPGAFIIFIGFPLNKDIFGIDDEIYKNANLYVDQLSAIQNEGSNLIKRGFEFEEIGKCIIEGRPKNEGMKDFILYQSLGFALMDTATVKLVLDKLRIS